MYDSDVTEAEWRLFRVIAVDGQRGAVPKHDKKAISMPFFMSIRRVVNTQGIKPQAPHRTQRV